MSQDDRPYTFLIARKGGGYTCSGCKLMPQNELGFHQDFEADSRSEMCVHLVRHIEHEHYVQPASARLVLDAPEKQETH